MSTIVHSYLRFPLKPPRHPLALAVEAHWRQQQGYQAPVVRQMRAMSLTMPSIVNHPNAIPWAGVLCRLGEASTRPPGGSQGHLVHIAPEVAQRALASLLGMAIDVEPQGLRVHAVRHKIGMVSEAYVEGADLRVSGHVFAKDFADEVRMLKRLQGQLGLSFEIADVDVLDPRDAIWDLTGFTFTGLAVLLKTSAAYQQTSFAL